ncbi:MAG: hypothetical protein JWQ35_2061, partial [Bacteriovoracaceae bacterium]|nr:hypothetical protein [Bacteriovoracaceae bacterium]
MKMVLGGDFRALACSFAFVAVTFIQSLTSSTIAASWQTNSFLKSINGSLYDFPFLVEGLNSVRAIGFKKDTTAQYQSFFNRIVLGLGIDDGAHRLKGLEGLDPEDFGTIAHESFHAFKANFIDQDPRFGAMKIWMKRRAEIVYGDLSESKRETALEEAYAVFIGDVISTRLNVQRILDRRPEMKCSIKQRMAESFWNIEWSSSVNGYYYRDGLGEYW